MKKLVKLIEFQKVVGVSICSENDRLPLKAFSFITVVGCRFTIQ